MNLGRRAKVRLMGRKETPRHAPTPILVSPRVAALLVVLAVLALMLVLYASPTTLIVGLGGAALAIVLSYPVRALSSMMPRPVAILLTFVALIGVFMLAGVLVVPLLAEQLSGLINQTPSIAAGAEQFMLDVLRPLEQRNLLWGAPPEQIVNDFVNELLARVQRLSESILNGLVGYLQSAFNFGVGLFGVLFVAAYLLVDVRKVKFTFLRAAPTRYRHDARDLWNAFETSLSRYLGGLLFVCIIQGVLSSLALGLIGVPYAVLLGAWVAITAIIPYLGAFLGAIPAILLALFEPNALTITLLTVIAYVVIQQLESNFLTPRIQGQALNVHPILVLLGVIAGGEIAGLAGVIFAVPALAIARVFFDFLRARIRTRAQPNG